MANRVSVKSARRAEISAEKARAKTNGNGNGHHRTTDSFQNLAAKIGINTDNLSSGGTYGFNPITRERTLLEWIHRGSWIAGLAVDIIPDDMTRNGVEIVGDVSPEDQEIIEEMAQVLNVWGNLRDTAAWARLYGGSIGVYLVDGQDYSTPLRLETIGKGQFRGVLPLDRWMVDPSLNDLVQEPGPSLGLPKFYTVMAQAPSLRHIRIHHTRVMRLDGNRLPYYQRVIENLWSQSVLERLYDRLLAFDSTTQGAAQLVYKSYLRTYAVKDLRELASVGGDALEGLASYINMMARFQSIEGITLIDAEDKFEAFQHAAFGGLSDVLVHFGQQISGALQIPLVRLFGQSPVGLNSTGESDLRTYYEGVANQQNRELKTGVTVIYRALAHSCGITPPPGYGIKFRPLWLLSESERATIGAQVTQAVSQGVDMGVSQKTALEELRSSASVTGLWSNITDEDIENAGGLSAPEPEEIAAIRSGEVELPESSLELPAPKEEGNGV
jgi:uncharacterized protein